MRSKRSFVPHFALAFMGIVLATLAWGSQLVALEGAPKATDKPSGYAPAEDLIAAAGDLRESIEEDLEDADDYGEDKQSRVAQNANTLAAVALVLGMHDKANPRKAAAAGLVVAAARLGEAAEKHPEAVKLLGAVKTAEESESDKELKWEAVADIQQLMKQVPIVNNRLRRGVTGRRFARLQKTNQQQAAILAAIAQASIFDTNYCADESDEKKWAAICIEMRDAAAAVNKAVRESDQDAAKKGLARLVETCDACHHSFRD